ncbi:hypothetical protein DQ238_06590 [Geodermatophilus sp. TF02-6]|uniref:hypothetical protein n=1 Tax=Geodermatophilus sp. TF02-6 TaxID=2250575 RepID=UPI000DEBF2E3|nr:hypothetical protein [Geodermatophilus sp. TF02-6]RBY81687.1 hypothetical protein DQ238_06590 [Geodermatophilus sp. TF02-6]
MTSPTPTPAAPPTPTDPIPSLIPPAATTTTSTTPTPAPAPNNAPATSGGGLTGAVLSAAVVAAIVSGSITTALARRATRLEERARVRTTLAEAYQAYADYKEFPYAIRRRRHDQDGKERIRLSEEVRRVQSRLSYYQAWTRAEDPTTGDAYNDLVGQLRRVTGASMRAAWLEPALDNDAGMNIGPDRVDLSELRTAEETFLKAAENHVKALTTPWWRRSPKPATAGPQE